MLDKALDDRRQLPMMSIMCQKYRDKATRVIDKPYCKNKMM